MKDGFLAWFLPWSLTKIWYHRASRVWGRGVVSRTGWDRCSRGGMFMFRVIVVPSSLLKRLNVGFHSWPIAQNCLPTVHKFLLIRLPFRKLAFIQEVVQQLGVTVAFGLSHEHTVSEKVIVEQSKRISGAYLESLLGPSLKIFLKKLP